MLGDRRAHGADVVVVGGDAVPGALARQALDRLNRLTVPVSWVRGNGEHEVSAAAAGPAGSGSDPDDPAARTAAVTAEELGTARARALGELPLTQTIDGVLFCHASPVATTRCSPVCRHRSGGRRHWQALTPAW